MVYFEPRLGIYYEHPDWYRPLFEELDRRGVPYDALHADTHRYDPSEVSSPYAVVFNRMSPSAYIRGRGHLTFYTLQYLAHLQRLGVRVVNGYEAWRTEISKAYQLTLLEGLGLPYPKARVIHHASQAPAAAEGLRFPVVVKPNIGGSGAGIVRFDTPESLARAADEGARARHRSHGAGAGVRDRGGRADRARRSARRQVPLRHPHLHDRRHLQSLPGRRLPGRGRRRARPRRVPDRRAEEQPPRRGLHAAGGDHRRGRADHEGRRHRARRRRIHDRRPRRPSLLLRRQRAVELRRRRPARARLRLRSRAWPTGCRPSWCAPSAREEVLS